MSVTWDDEPDEDVTPDEAAPRKKRKSNRFAAPRTPRDRPAPLAPFLLDPSLLPKKPPGMR